MACSRAGPSSNAGPAERRAEQWGSTYGPVTWTSGPSRPARAHNDGTVSQFIEEVLAFPHKQRTEDLQRFIDAILSHDTSDRLPQIAVPTLVLAGRRDSTSRPELCRAVADGIPGAHFEVMEQEAHQPFQEVPDQWNARVQAFWREVEELAS